jgi:hypothetical protein
MAKISDKKLKAAWKKINEDKMVIPEIAKELNVQPPNLRKALAEKHGQSELVTALRKARQSSDRVPTGAQAIQFAKNVIKQKPTTEQYDTIISNLEDAVDLLLDARNEL